MLLKICIRHQHPIIANMSSAEKKSSKVVLWSTPRSVSTALTKCLSFVPNSAIWFEPYVSAMIHGSDAREVEVPASQAEADPDIFTQARQIIIPDGVGFDADKCSYKWCQEQLEIDYPGKSVVFVQAKCTAIATRFDAIPRGYKHSFLIRNPLKVLPSWKRAIYKVEKPDTALETFTLSQQSQLSPRFFFKETYDLYQHIKENYESDPIILDADDLLMNPGKVLKAYCNAMDIPYTDDLLHWDQSDDVIMTWNVRSILLKLQQLDAFTFYDKAFTSSEFLKPSTGPSREDLTEDDLQCIDFSMPYYEKMYDKRLVC
ncbi:uncharacterized protein [Amphiura filiformis]|uniref:uncharacterized protein isoform X2 n=1 Tax=Amphiura filiformis TaxID=82378 RepID=UPI003B20E75F